MQPMQTKSAHNTQTLLTYEQPLNEHMRICLRLEHLFNELSTHIDNPSPISSRLAIGAIIKIMDVVDRPDVKSKLTQSLTQLATAYSQLQQSSQVNTQRLAQLLSQLDVLINNLHNDRERIGDSLRKNDFLGQVRLNSGNPGGAYNYSTPAYLLWLSQPANKRIQDLNTWSSQLQELRNISELILHLTRKSTNTKTLFAQDGFYHQSLNPTSPCELIRVIIPAHLNIYPEFSVGRHRLTIRFVKPDYLQASRPEQLRANIEFELACCRI